MKRVLALGVFSLVVAVSLAACGPPTMHPGPETYKVFKDDGTETTLHPRQSFEQDSYDCQRKVIFWIFDRSLYKSCMRGRGQVD